MSSHLKLQITRFALVISALVPFSSYLASGTPEGTPTTNREGTLAIGIFRELASKQPGNVVFSPYSMEAVLRLLEQGAGSGTKEMLNNLPMGTPDVPSAMDVQTANALFVASDLKLNGSFRDLFCCPFTTDSAAAIRQINDWCSTQTRGCIPTLVSEATITPGTRLVAANAVYLKEAWLHPFESHNTHTQWGSVSDSLRF